MVYEIDWGGCMSNPYWERICEIANKQRQKGIDTYGQEILIVERKNFAGRDKIAIFAVGKVVHDQLPPNSPRT